jgi:hypothetical protein
VLPVNIATCFRLRIKHFYFFGRKFVRLWPQNEGLVSLDMVILVINNSENYSSTRYTAVRVRVYITCTLYIQYACIRVHYTRLCTLHAQHSVVTVCIRNTCTSSSTHAYALCSTVFKKSKLTPFIQNVNYSIGRQASPVWHHTVFAVEFLSVFSVTGIANACHDG